MNISLNTSIKGLNAARLFSPVAPVKFNAAKSQPGDVVYFSNPNEVTTVLNTPQERMELRKALASHLPRFTFWKVYIGEVNRHFGVNHYWEIPSDRISEALSFIASMFENPAPLFPSYSQSPVTPEVNPAPEFENLENARYELEAVLSQFENYRKWFKEQSDLMDFAITSINRTLATID